MIEAITRPRAATLIVFTVTVFDALMGLVIAAAIPGRPGVLRAQGPAGQSKSDRSASAPRDEGASSSGSSAESYPGYLPINRGDVLDVTVFDEPQLSCLCTVGPTGTIILA